MGVWVGFWSRVVEGELKCLLLASGLGNLVCRA